MDAADGVDDTTAVGHRTHRAGADDVRDRVGILDDPRAPGSSAVAGSGGGASVERAAHLGLLANAQSEPIALDESLDILRFSHARAA